MIGRAGLKTQLESVPTRQVVHLALAPTLIHLEPEGDETVLSEGKPVGMWYTVRIKFPTYILIEQTLYPET